MQIETTSAVEVKVSVIVPTYNEELYIKSCLDSFLEQTHKNLEIIVIDGRSSDATLNIVRDFAARHDNIKILINDKRYTPYAFNMGIENSMGSIICIAGVHAYYPEDYIEKCIQLHKQYPDVANVGGRIIIRPSGNKLVERAIAIAVSHRFGVGSSSFRTFKKRGFVETLFPGSYKRNIFKKHGLYDERLIRGQDQGFNKRIIRAGEKIYFDPDITVYYYPRGNLKNLAMQFYKTGRSIIYTSKTLNELLSFRQVIPLLFLVSFLVCSTFGVITFFYGIDISIAFIPLALCIGPYLLIICVISILAALKSRSFFFIFALSSAFITLHLSYGLGTLVGLLTLFNWWKQNKDYEIKFLK